MDQYTEAEDRLFCNRLRDEQYRRVYRVSRGEDGIYGIACRRGDIEPYSLNEEGTAVDMLCCCLEFRSKQAKTYGAKKIPSYCTVTQEGDRDLVFSFPLERLNEVATIVGAYRRQQLSDVERERRRQAGRELAASRWDSEKR